MIEIKVDGDDEITVVMVVEADEEDDGNNDDTALLWEEGVEDDSEDEVFGEDGEKEEEEEGEAEPSTDPETSTGRDAGPIPQRAFAAVASLVSMAFTIMPCMKANQAAAFSGVSQSKTSSTLPALVGGRVEKVRALLLPRN